MQYIQTVNTLKDANEFKESILSQKLTDSKKFLIRVKETNSIVSFKTTDWQLPKKPVVFEYEKELVPTQKFINILLKNKMLGSSHDYANDKNVYIDELPNITSLKTLFTGTLDTNTCNIKKSKNIINDLSCLEKLEYIEDISGVAADGSYQNLFGAVDLKKVRLPKTLTCIGKSAFAFCLALNDIIIPENVNTIKSKAFYDCISLTEISIPASVTSIESMVFANSNIVKVIMNSSIPPTIMKTTFKNMKSNFCIYVSEENYDTYVQTWSTLADHIVIKNN